MKVKLPTNRQCCLGGLTVYAVALFSGSALSQSWQTVDDFQYVAARGAYNTALATTPNGALLAAGYASDLGGLWHALVMSSLDGGSTWSTPLDDFCGPLPGDDARYLAVGYDPAGNLYAAGTYSDASDPNLTDHWIVRRSTAGGGGWTTVDDIAASGTWYSQANSIATDAAGNVYLAGLVSDSAWIIRKGIGGTNFVTIDSVPSSSGNAIGASAILVHPTLGVFAAGQANVTVKGTSVAAWVVRRSTDGGRTWQTVDTVYTNQGPSYYFGQAHSIAADSHGYLYVAGAIAVPYKGSSGWEWLVRRSTNGGNSWSTVDSYQLAPGDNSRATAIVADSAGNIYVAGYGNSTFYGSEYWIVRENPGGVGTWTTVDSYQLQPGDGAQGFAAAVSVSGSVFVGGGANSSSGGHWVLRKR
jgi:hypothetical protein